LSTPGAEPNFGFVPFWIFRLEHEEFVDVIHGVLHDHLHLLIADSGKTVAARACGTGLSGMDVLNRSIAERQRDYSLRFRDDLLASNITFHVRRF
jgi:hypothetical protein